MVSGYRHQPVLLRESLAHLALQPGAIVVDATLGGGAHAAAILAETAPNGRLVGLDVDAEALEAAGQRLAPFGDRVQLIRASFRGLRRVLEQLEIAAVHGVLFDLGVSSRQIDAPERGFRFAEDSAEVSPLDMRMDAAAPTTAADLLGAASVDDLARWFRSYGEIPRAMRLARAIVETRERAPLRTARDLLRVIAAARVGGGRRHHPATLVFQALRIAVNDEIAALEEGIEAGIDCLFPGGRLVAIAYHSIEDRIAKNHLRDAQRGCVCPPKTPVCICGCVVRLRVVTRRPVRSGDDELRENPRARSARLRAAERVAEAA